MTTETYTPGHSATSVAFMQRRTLDSHGQFFKDQLRPGNRVLDCGCGPGTLSLSIAEFVAPGKVTGVDFMDSQVERAKRAAEETGTLNVEFRVASGYELPFEDASFDRVFSHALLEHLAEPWRAVREFYRVLVPGGVVGVCTPDVGGLLVAPEAPGIVTAVRTYNALQKSNGGDLETGRRLGGYLADAGFSQVQMSARYECHVPGIISEYLGQQLETAGLQEHADAFREWSRSPGAMFAQPWVSAVGVK